MVNEIYEGLRLTAVGCPSDVTLPSLVVSKVLSQQLSDIGMSDAEPDSEITNTFVRGERKEKDPAYSLASLKESPTDILGLYYTDLREAEIKLYVDSCMGASKDLSVSLDHLLQIVLIHELAHHVTAWATIVDDYGPCEWTDYNQCNRDPWPSVHEFFAQMLSFVWIAKHEKKLLDAFKVLSRNQPSIYRTWEVFDAFHQDGVSLNSIRKTLRDQFFVFLRSNKRRWIIPHKNLHDDQDIGE